MIHKQQTMSQYHLNYVPGLLN